MGLRSSCLESLAEGAVDGAWVCRFGIYSFGIPGVIILGIVSTMDGKENLKPFKVYWFMHAR
jgi:cobalamin biosynthesis protein CobD/CbiB